MNKSIWLYSLILGFGISFNVCLGSNLSWTTLEAQKQQDSLRIDTEPIQSRHFESLPEKYTGDEFIYERNIQNSGWWTRLKLWLNDVIRSLFSLDSEGQASQIMDIIFQVFGVLIFLSVIYFIFRAVMNDEGKWIFGKSSEKNIIPITDIENNIHITDFEHLIEEAEKDKNYRLAVRYYYLWLLKGMTNAQFIEYDVEKTNSDYFNEIVSPEIKKEFSYTSYLYNYIWYGEFNVTAKQYDNAKHSFIAILNTIKA